MTAIYNYVDPSTWNAQTDGPQQIHLTILVSLIEAANNRYNNEGESGVEDAVYDGWIEQLRKMDPKHAILTSVGAEVPDTDAWEKFDHGDFQMGSQAKVNTYPELQEWAKQYSDEFIVEHKLDGSSLKLIYENGTLKSGVTRGKNGKGENIYRNAMKMHGVPNKIKDQRRFVIRSEILLYKSKFDKIGGKNCRNSATGTAKRHDGEGCQHLDVVTYAIMNWEELGLKTNTEMLGLLKKLGFTTVQSYGPFKTIKEADNVKTEYETSKRKALDWDVDGLIIQTNTLAKDKWDLPTRSIAYKFFSEKGVTKLIGVDWRDSGGRIAPRAILEPVNVGGVTITHATLNNFNFIQELGIKIGDLVEVSRRNDVIPAIECVSIADPNGKVIDRPLIDKDGFPIVFETNSEGDELVYLITSNPNSRSRQIRKILAWYTDHNTKGVAGETIESILESGCATDLPSFFDVGIHGHPMLDRLEGFGEGKFKILNTATKLTANSNIVDFFAGMDMRMIGKSRVEAILRYRNAPTSAEQFITLCQDESYISDIPGFGSNTAKSLADSVKSTLPTIRAMMARVTCAEWAPLAIAAGSLVAGKTFCFTGAHTEDRDTLEAKAKAAGGLASGSVSKKLNYLVSPKEWTSGKVEKAISLGVKIIDETEFNAMLGKQG